MSTTKNQGEGDYEAAKRYDDATTKFVDSGKVPAAAKAAAPRSPAEAAALLRAESRGKERAKGPARAAKSPRTSG